MSNITAICYDSHFFQAGLVNAKYLQIHTFTLLYLPCKKSFLYFIFIDFSLSLHLKISWSVHELTTIETVTF